MSTEAYVEGDQLATQLELARRLLRLEQRVDAYQRLYEEELDQILRSLKNLERQFLALAAFEEGPVRRSSSPSVDELDEQS